MDYSSLVLTLSLSSIFAKVSQFHTLRVWAYFSLSRIKHEVIHGVSCAREYEYSHEQKYQMYKPFLRVFAAEAEKNITANRKISPRTCEVLFLLVKSSNLKVSGEL